MSWKSSDLSSHYIRMEIEGSDPENFLNQCIRKRICLNDIRRTGSRSAAFSVRSVDLKKIEELAGNRYKIHIKGRGGFWYRLKLLRYKKGLLIGIVLFAGLMYYQSLFISEITVSGYESISEEALRESAEEAGLYEGCRKSININKVKLHLYDEFDNISWVGIKFEGNLAKLTIAESGMQYESAPIEDDSPCNIVAEKEGYIASVIPREGMRTVEDGAFVKAGTVLISGEIPFESTVYGTEDENRTAMYVHADGDVKAKIPVRLEFYRHIYDTKLKVTGRKVWSLCVNGKEFPAIWLPYEYTAVKHIDLINAVKPFRLKLQLVSRQKADLKRVEVAENVIKDEVLNEIQRYIKEKLPEDTQILNKSLNFVQEKNIISIGVTLETLQQIGIEEEIIIDKSNGNFEKDGDQ